MADIKLGEGEAWYQSEPLTTRLKNIIRDYPEGVGIIKELLQNADDAGATRVEIVFDWRTHNFSQLPDPRMKALLGAAMLVYNDSQFTDEDFNNIRSLGDSGKRETLWKTGRFGIGFNSVYHVTDYPSLISRDRIVFFDPHATAIPKTTLSQPGYSWKFAEEGWWDGYPEFMGVYEPGGLRSSTQNFEGTLFRLPLRTAAHAKQSKIRNDPFTQENVHQLLAEFVKVGEEMLLFLKSVLTIRVGEIDSDGNKRSLLAITTQNDQAVKVERRKLLAPLQKDADVLLARCQNSPEALPAVSYRHTIEVATPENQTVSTWRVTSLIRAEGELLNLMQELAAKGEKAVPWAGTAALISRTGSAQSPAFVGRAYCFLPLPQETGLPIHINGFFDLDSSRRELTSDNTLTGRDKRVCWNQLLVNQVLSHAYANLIVSLVDDIGEKDPERFYKFFPTQSKTKALAELPTCVIKLLQSRRVIRSAIEHPFVVQQNSQRQVGKTRWVAPQTIKILPKEWKNLLEPLRLDGVDLPDPFLPPELEDAFSTAKITLTDFKPGDLRSRLLTREPLGMPIAEAPRKCLRSQEWVTNLLRYCLNDGCRDVRGLPLAILADGTLQRFGYNPPAFIYLVPTSEEEILMNQIFKSYPSWFLDADFARQVKASSVWEGVSMLTPVETAKRLKDLINPEDRIQIEWESDGEQIPNANWLSQVYTYLADVKVLPRDELMEVPLVPCNDGLLYIGGSAETPLWHGTSTSKETLDTFQYFEVPLIEAQAALQSAINKFRDRHPDTLIFRLTVPGLIDKLDIQDDLPAYNSDFYKGLVGFLADCQWMQGEGKNDQVRKQKLCQLQIYPTTEGLPTDLKNVYAPGGYIPPKAVGSLKLLCLRANENNQEWKRFYDFLGVPVLDRAAIIQNLLEDYTSFQINQQMEALEWIRDHLSIAQTELEKRNQSIDLKKRVREAPLIRCTDGQLRAASAIYDPSRNYSAVWQVLGDRAHSPDMTIYKNAEHWLDFFRELRMLATPSANDILAYVDRQIQQAKIGVTDAIAKHLTDIFSHLEKHWERLEKEKVSTSGETLSEALKMRAWLPVERDQENLKRYLTFLVPQNKLYRSDEVYVSFYGFHTASQKPLFVVSQRPKKEFEQAFGFCFPSREDVVNHLKVLIQLWEVGKVSASEDKTFQQSINSVYNYFSTVFPRNRATDEERQWLRNQLQEHKCLWYYAEFWKPEHTFQVNISFFGKRRQKISLSSPIREVYELLGQKRQPGIGDYLAFLAQLARECKGEPLEADDVKCAYEVLKLLTRDLELEKRSPANYDLLLLTDDNLLLPPDQILIPDAPWWLDAIVDRTQVKILHPEVPHSLAIGAGSRSLLSDVIEQPTNISPSNDQDASKLCQKWRNLLRSPEFIGGLERLIVDQYGLDAEVELSWLARAEVKAASKITTNLLLGDHCIASGLQGSYYFDLNKYVFYLNHEGEELMRHHLTESLNHQLGSFKLSATSRLMMMLNSQPSGIEYLLDQLKVKTLKRSTPLPVAFDEVDEAEFDQIFDANLLDEFETDNVGVDKEKNGDEQKPANPSVTDSNGSVLGQPIAKPSSAPATPNSSTTTSPPIPSLPVQPVANPIIEPVKPIAPVPQGRSIPDVKSAAQSSEEDGSEKMDRQFVLVPSARSRNNVTRLRLSGSGKRSRSSNKPRSQSKTTHSNQQYRNGVRVRSGLEVDPNKSIETEVSEAEGKKIDRAGMVRVLEYERCHGEHVILLERIIH